MNYKSNGNQSNLVGLNNPTKWGHGPWGLHKLPTNKISITIIYIVREIYNFRSTQYNFSKQYNDLSKRNFGNIALCVLCEDTSQVFQYFGQYIIIVVFKRDNFVFLK